MDLGIGILTLFCRDEGRRAAMLNSIGPVWHANLTWLVVLGGLLFGAFPLAYGLILSALYIPLVLMLWGLIFRGVSLDFRGEARSKRPWNLGFGLGSLLAALAQGFILGALVSGFKVEGRAFAGGVWDWLNPLAALVALGVLCAYLLLGATYLILKTEGEVGKRPAPRPWWRPGRCSSSLRPRLLGHLQISFPGPAAGSSGRPCG